MRVFGDLVALLKVENHILVEDDSVTADDHIAVGHTMAMGSASAVFDIQVEVAHMSLLNAAIGYSDLVLALARVLRKGCVGVHCPALETDSEEPAPIVMRYPEFRCCWFVNQLSCFDLGQLSVVLTANAE